MPRILVVEDDGAIRRALVDALRFAGHQVHEAADGINGQAMAIQGAFDLILLDLILPGMDGVTLLREVRATCPTLPVIMLTACGAEDDRVRGLAGGADDYVVKPFSVRELLARVVAVLRRSAQRLPDRVEIPIPDGMVDLARLEIRFADGGRTALLEREAGLLRYLALHRGRPVSREELLERVWRIDAGGLSGSGGTRSVDMQVARLREKLRDQEAEPQVVLTVRGIGYMLANP
jgi:DNA-binding response OmpR family regulator